MTESDSSLIFICWPLGPWPKNSGFWVWIISSGSGLVIETSVWAARATGGIVKEKPEAGPWAEEVEGSPVVVDSVVSGIANCWKL